MATLPGAWRYGVSTGTGRTGVSILWLGEVEHLICNFYLSVAACKIEQIRPWDTLACCWDVKQPTNKHTIDLQLELWESLCWWDITTYINYDHLATVQVVTFQLSMLEIHSSDKKITGDQSLCFQDFLQSMCLNIKWEVHFSKIRVCEVHGYWIFCPYLTDHIHTTPQHIHTYHRKHEWHNNGIMYCPEH